jgi:hypothetical protein
MAGVASGYPQNVSVDEKGYLHLNIEKRDGKWTAAELFTVETLGFGTYRWVVEGNVYDMDPTTVLGLFPYGPVHHIGTDAENEIDIEFSKWNDTCHGCNADFTVYPSTGNRKPKGVSAWETTFMSLAEPSPPPGWNGPQTTSYSRSHEQRSSHRHYRRHHQDGDLLVGQQSIPHMALPVGSACGASAGHREGSVCDHSNFEFAPK